MKNKVLDLGIGVKEVDELLKVSKNIDKDYKKLLKGYPIQYLIGYSNFYGYKFKINKNVLIPRFETELLVEKSIKHIKEFVGTPKNIIDLGTGSGCIAITLNKEFKESSVEGIDISSKALKLAKYNNILNKTNVKFYKYNMLKKLKREYDVIIGNPPYVSKDEIISEQVKKYEPNIALYASEEGLLFYKKILSNLINNEKTLICFEIGHLQADSIKKITKELYPDSKVIVEKDLSGKDRYIFIFLNKK